MSLNYIANSIEMSHSAHRLVIVYCRHCLFIERLRDYARNLSAE